MASKHAPRRAPAHFVPVTPARWAELCDVLDSEVGVPELRSGGALVGFHAWRVWAVDADAFRELVGRWPPGYWPESA